MHIIYTILAVVIGFSIIVIVHEWGHYISAKLFKVRIEEFAIGFGPKIFGKKGKDVNFSVRAMPLGGYVRFADPSYDETKSKENAYSDDDPHLLLNIAVWKRLIIYATGAIMNLVLGFVMLVIFYLILGMPTNQPTVASVIAGTPAERSGLTANDIILKIDGNDIIQDDYNKAIEQISSLLSEKQAEFVVLRDNREETLLITPEYSEEDNAYKIGFYFGYSYRNATFFEAVSNAWTVSGRMLSLLYTTFAEMFTTGKGLENLSGPIGLVSVVSDATREGILSVVSIFISLTFNLAVVNLFPFPALDGGKIVLLGLEAIRKKPLKRETEGIINAVGFILLLILAVVVSIKDIINI